MPVETRSVETTGLAWGVRTSFRRYVQRVALGSERIDGGAGELPDGRLYFPVRSVTRFADDVLDAEVSFAGGVRMVGHGDLIDLRLGDFELNLSAGTGMLRTSSVGGIRDFVEVRVTQATVDHAVIGLILESRLAPGAEELFDGVYAAGTAFDDLELRIARPA